MSIVHEIIKNSDTYYNCIANPLITKSSIISYAYIFEDVIFAWLLGE